MSKRYKAKRRFRYYVQREKCQHCGAGHAVACYLPEPYGRDRMPDEMLCGECAGRAGYCRSCGEFWGGIESFDFHHPGLCDHCHDQMRDDFEASFDEEPDYTLDDLEWDEAYG